jgi:hypothetical protein
VQKKHYQYLLIDLVIGTAITNFVINIAVGYGLFRTMSTIPLWGSQSIAGDTIGTAFLLPLIFTPIITMMTHKKIQKGTLPASNWRRSSHALLGKLPQKTWGRALIFGLLFLAISASITILLLKVLNITEMNLWPFIFFKASFSAVLAVLVAPIVAICAIGDA